MRWQLVWTCSALFFALGCTQGAPTISATEELPPIILDHDSFESRSFDLFDITFSGRVSKFVSELEVSFDSGGTWTKLENSLQSSLKIDLASCSVNCPFTYAVNNVGQKWARVSALPLGEEITGWIRGTGVYGFTSPTTFKLKRLNRGFFAVGAIGLNRLGTKAKTLSPGFKVLGGRLEAQKTKSVTLSDGTTSVTIKAQGVVQ